MLAYLDPKSGRDDVDKLLEIFFPAPAGSDTSSLFVVKYFPPNITPWGPAASPNASATPATARSGDTVDDGVCDAPRVPGDVQPSCLKGARPQRRAQSRSPGHWFELYSRQLNLSVVVIAGTDIGKVNDVVEDVKIWIEPVGLC